MVRLVRPKYFPHWGRYAYTRWGFRHRVSPRLLRLGFSPKEIARLEDLYFCRRYVEHQDYTGTYRNVRKYRLHALSRKLKGDRKRCLFSLVERSGLFFCYYWEDGSMAAFVSPFASGLVGVMPVMKS